jgi:hypothetical protein
MNASLVFGIRAMPTESAATQHSDQTMRSRLPPPVCADLANRRGIADIAKH